MHTYLYSLENISAKPKMMPDELGSGCLTIKTVWTELRALNHHSNPIYICVYMTQISEWEGRDLLLVVKTVT